MRVRPAGAGPRRANRPNHEGRSRLANQEAANMSRQDANAAFARTSFLYGGNAAYIEDLYARYETDPATVDAEWRDFFAALKDEKTDVVKSAKGASWKKPNWPPRADGDLVSALDG